MELKKPFLALLSLFIALPAMAQNPFDNPSFEFTTFQPKDCQGVCKFPDNWEYDDCNPEGALCEKAQSTDGNVGVGVNLTATAGCCTTYAEMWQADVNLTGICEISIDQIGPGFGEPENSKHVVLINGAQVQDCGFVGQGGNNTCPIDVSGFTGEHEVRIRWEQRAGVGNDLGNSVIDNIRVTESSSDPPVEAMTSRDSICPGDSTILSFNGGDLGEGGDWVWYQGSCGGAIIGSGSSVKVHPVTTDSYYVRAEGGCGDTTTCASVEVTVKDGAMIPDTVISEPGDTICRGDSALLYQLGGGLELDGRYEWYRDSCENSAPIGTGDSIRVSPTVDTTGFGIGFPFGSVLDSTTYYVRSIGECDTTECDSITISVNPVPSANAGDFETTCGGDTVSLGPDTTDLIIDTSFFDPDTIYAGASGGIPPYTYSWGPEENVVDSGDTPFPNVSTKETRDFILTVTDSNGCQGRDTTYVYIDRPFCDDYHVFVPNAFSPNGDGINDELKVMGKGIESFEMVIYNRWGEQIFRTKSKDNGWDGTYNGKVLDPAVFVYKITGYFIDGQQFKEEGSINLLR